MLEMQHTVGKHDDVDGDCKELAELGITQLLDGDPRVAFVVYARQHWTSTAPVYCNPALDGAHELKLALFTPPEDSSPASTFAQWVNGAGSGDRCVQLGHDWSAAVVMGHWKVISGKSGEEAFGTTGKGNPDTTRPGAIPNPSPHIQLLWSVDWSKTALGPMSTWSPKLRREVNTTMADPRAVALYWGESRTIIYNESYAQLAAEKHPRIMGQTVMEAWPEAYDDFGHLIDDVTETWQPFTGGSTLLCLERSGYLEETYMSFHIIPVAGERGYQGFTVTLRESTEQELADRRMSTLLVLGQCLSVSKDVKGYWKQCLKGLEPNGHDIPFAALYSISSGEVQAQESQSDNASCSSSRSSMAGAKAWALEGVLGLDHTDLPSRLDSELVKEQFTPLFHATIRAGQHTMLTVADDTFPKCLVNRARSRAFGDNCTSALLIPIGPSTRDNVLGFLLIGINPRRAYDSSYQHFVQLLTRQLATSLASIVLIEEEQRRNDIAAKLAAEDRIRLSTLSYQLEETTALAADSELRFRRMADLAPAGLSHTAPDGTVLYANESFYELTGHPRDAFYPLSWYNFLHEDDYDLVGKEWEKLSRGESTSFEVRFKKPFITDEILFGEQVRGTTWILSSALAITSKDGTVTGILGCLTDISRQKWVEGFQEHRKNEAIEMKRVQENFMDMTSHEMRNPLSAIILCGDVISSALSEMVARCDDPISLSREEVLNHAEAASTVVLCAQHQKRIIDDVLTLSKLDAGMLLVTPVEVQPADSIQRALKIFDGELRKADATLRYIIDPSYEEVGVDWVRLDPSRMLQVLINLLTNAIKFTQAQRTRQITVTVKASVQRPSSDGYGVHYISPDKPWNDAIDSAKTEQPVFISIAVKDTGRGLTHHEKDVLFKRFSQASAKTHVEYGGSGLGLFISRQLTELQCGQIGVASEAGVGSTFAFYCKALRCAAPMKGTTATKEITALATLNSALAKTTLGVVKAQTNHDQSAKNAAVEETFEQTAVKHLLVVEDNIVNQKVMSKQLRQAGFDVSVANHGLEALDHVRETLLWSENAASPEAKKLDVILCDVEMPVMDGLTFTRKIRNLQRIGQINGHVPIIAITANARSEQQDSAIDAGMDTVITKPFRMPELIHELKKLGSLHITDHGGGRGSVD